MKKADKQIKVEDLHFVDFALKPGPVRKEKSYWAHLMLLFSHGRALLRPRNLKNFLAINKFFPTKLKKIKEKGKYVTNHPLLYL